MLSRWKNFTSSFIAIIKQSSAPCLWLLLKAEKHWAAFILLWLSKYSLLQSQRGAKSPYCAPQFQWHRLYAPRRAFFIFHHLLHIRPHFDLLHIWAMPSLKNFWSPRNRSLPLFFLLLVEETCVFYTISPIPSKSFLIPFIAWNIFILLFWSLLTFWSNWALCFTFGF